MSTTKGLPSAKYVRVFEGTENERTITVPKLKLGRAAQLVAAFQRLPETIMSLAENPEIAAVFKQANDDTPITEIARRLLRFLPDIIVQAQDVVIEILSIGTDLSRDEVAELGLDEATEILGAILEVNNLERIRENLKNIGRRLGLNLTNLRIPQIQTTGSSTSSTPSPIQ